MRNAIPPRLRTSSAQPARTASFPKSAEPIEERKRNGPAMERGDGRRALKDAVDARRSPRDREFFPFPRRLFLFRTHGLLFLSGERFLLGGREHGSWIRELDPRLRAERVEDPLHEARTVHALREDGAEVHQCEIDRLGREAPADT